MDRNLEEEKRAYVEELTRRFCDDYGAIDGDAVRLIVENAVRRTADVDGSRAWHLELSPADHEELFSLFPLETHMKLAAGRLFLPSLDPGSIFCKYINDPAIPYYTYGELADLIEEMNLHLERESGSLLETGYPSTRFGPSLFLDRLLGNLLPVRVTATGKVPGGPLEGLTEHDEEWARGHRPVLLQTKRRILPILAAALRRGSAVTLRDNCLSALGEEIRLEDWETSNRIEALYDPAERAAGGDRSQPQEKDWARTKRENVLLCPGGVNDLVGVVAHCEDELTTGRFHRTKVRLGTLDCGVKPEGYVDVLAQHCKLEFDRIMERFFDMEQQSGGFRLRFDREFFPALGKVLEGQTKAGTVTSRASRMPMPTVPPSHEMQLKLEPRIRLTEDQEREAKEFEYKSRWPIDITGEIHWRGDNSVLVGGSEIALSDALLAVLLRLVVELFRQQDGTVYKVDLIGERLIHPDYEHKWVSRLRKPFIPVMGRENAKRLLEIWKPKTLRLSTHLALIRYNKKRLLRHDNAVVVGLAKQLPDENPHHKSRRRRATKRRASKKRPSR